MSALGKLIEIDHLPVRVDAEHLVHGCYYRWLTRSPSTTADAPDLMGSQARGNPG